MRTVHPLPLDNLHPLQMAVSASQNSSPHPQIPPSPSPHPNDHHASLIESVVNAITNPSTASSSAQNASQASNLPQSNPHSPHPPHPSLSSNQHPPPPPPGPDVSLQSVIASSSKHPQHPPLHHQHPHPSTSGIPIPWPVMFSPTLHELPASRVAAGKRKHDDSDPSEDPHPKIRRVVRDHVSQDPSRVVPMTTVICLHAAVAQKSYGSEKRFLCPPPVVHIEGPLWRMRQQQLSMSVVSEMGERSFEQKSSLDAHMSACFKFLHVSGTAKAKSFLLSLDISEQPQHAVATPEGGQSSPGRTWATFDSAPITIISKPSKKTAKTRNTASCILGGNPISLFNRINSQTVRTKYMTIDQNQLCASNVSWSAFSVNLVIKPGDVHSHPQSPVTYGCEVILTDAQTGISTAPLIIRKVDKGKIVPDDGGPVSQMQKIALQRINSDGARHYLSAAGPLPGTHPGAPPTPSVTPPSSQPGTHPLIFQSPRVREEIKDGVRVVTDEVDDYLCWTIVGISKFQYTFFDAFGSNEVVPEMPITPFPTLFTAPIYRPAGNSLEMTISNFFYEHPKTRVQTPLDVYVGNIGPLPLRLYQSGPAGPLTSVNPFVHAVPPGPEGGSPSIDPAQAEAAAQAALAQPRYFPTHSLHSIVIAELPPIGEIIRAIEEDAMPAGQRNDGENGASADGDRPGQDEESRSPPGEKDSGIATTIAPPHISGRGLPLLFIRSADGVGYHSGRTIACENVFQNMDLNAMGQHPQNPGAGSIDTGWLAAAQAAAAADGGLHGWTLRVM